MPGVNVAQNPHAPAGALNHRQDVGFRTVEPVDDDKIQLTEYLDRARAVLAEVDDASHLARRVSMGSAEPDDDCGLYDPKCGRHETDRNIFEAAWAAAEYPDDHEF